MSPHHKIVVIIASSMLAGCVNTHSLQTGHTLEQGELRQVVQLTPAFRGHVVEPQEPDGLRPIPLPFAVYEARGLGRKFEVRYGVTMVGVLLGMKRQMIGSARSPFALALDLSGQATGFAFPLVVAAGGASGALSMPMSLRLHRTFELYMAQAISWHAGEAISFVPAPYSYQVVAWSQTAGIKVNFGARSIYVALDVDSPRYGEGRVENWADERWVSSIGLGVEFRLGPGEMGVVEGIMRDIF